MLAITDYYIDRKKSREPFRMTLYEKDLEGEDILSQWGCGAGRGRICIGVDGSLYGCAKIVGVDGLQDSHRLGDIWTGVTNLSARRDLLNTHPNARPRCASCESADRCSGGCPAVNWEATGSIFDPAPLECRITPIVRRIQEHHRRRADEAGLNTAPD